jgi:hypothetical protein
MNIREISDVFKDTAGDIEALKSYNFGWASDRVRQGNTEDFQELNTFPRVFFSVPTITASDQTRKQDTYQVTLFFDDLLGYDNEGDADLTLQIDKWAALQQYATAFIQGLNLIKQTILPNYLFIPEPPQFTFDSFVGIQRLVTVQVNFNLIVPTNCEVTVKRIIELVGNAIATGTSQANIFLSTSVSAYVECKATATGFIVTGQQNIIEVDASVTAFALASGDIVRVKNVSATTIATATAQAEVQRAVNIIGELNATGQVSGNINLTLFATGLATGTANVNANLEVTTQGLVECEANVTGTSVTNGSLFVIRTLEAQSIGQATSQSQIILSKLLSASVIGSAVSEANINVTTQNVTTFDAFVTATATSEANIQRVISINSSVDTAVTTSAEAQITRVLNADATATANTEASAQLTIPVTAQATAIAESSAAAQITRIISAEATATAESSAEANFGITFNAGIEATATITNAIITRTATLTASLTGAATVTNATLDVIDGDAAAYFSRVITAGGTLSATEQSAVNTLVLALKADGIWTKMKAIYPMVGASAAACSRNLKSDTFNGTFSAGWTFASTGATPNGTSAYLNTNLNPSTDLSQNTNHLSFYSRTNNSGSTSIEIGSLNTNVISYFHSHIFYNDGALIDKYYMLLAQNVANPVTNTNSLGFFNGNRKSSSIVSHFKNGSNIQDLTATSVALNSFSVFIGAGNINGSASNFSSRQCAFASIGDGLTDTEAANFYTDIQAFQTTLSRNV